MINKLNILISTGTLSYKGIRTVRKGTFNYSKPCVQVCNQTIAAIICSLFVPWHSCFPFPWSAPRCTLAVPRAARGCHRFQWKAEQSHHSS